MTLVVTADGAFVQVCDPCHRAYRAGYDAAQELARLEKRNAAIGGPMRRRASHVR